MAIWLKALSVLILTFAISNPALAGRLKVKKVTASSTLPEAMGVSYAPQQAVDGKVSTYWAEGEASAGMGDWIAFDFGKDVTLTKIVLYSGNWDSHEFFKRYNRLKRIQVKFSDRSSLHLDVEDKMERQVLTLPKPVKTRMVRMVLKDIYAGSTFNDTCLAEAQFYDDKPSELVTDVKATATSVLPPDSAGSYGADKLLDGIEDLIWCEGKKNGPGVGESISMVLPSERAIKELRILNGVAHSEKVYKKNNRVTRLKVELSGGETLEAPVEDQFGEYQTIALEGKKTTAIKLTILDTVAGTKFNDTCMSEIQIVAAP